MPPIALWDYSWDRLLLCSQVIEISRTAADTPSATQDCKHLNRHRHLQRSVLCPNFDPGSGESLRFVQDSPSRAYSRIPYATEQGISKCVSGSFCAEQGILIRSAQPRNPNLRMGALMLRTTAGWRPRRRRPERLR